MAQNEYRNGIIFAITAYSMWGILAIYWKLVDSVPPLEVLANRIIGAFLFTALLIVLCKQWEALLQILRDRKQLLSLVMASVLISINWGIYIWAVHADKIVDASLGYFMNPLFAILLGVLFFREQIDRWTGVALFTATLGVVIKTVQYGAIPWVSLSLSISFGIYSAIKKSVKANALVGLSIETAMITPFAAAFLLLGTMGGSVGYEEKSPLILLLLAASGVVTAVPLMLFAAAAKQLSLTLIGFIQYISPSLSLLIGVFIFHEPFTGLDLLSFCLIWVALAIYSFAQLNLSKRMRLPETAIPAGGASTPLAQPREP